MNHKRKTHRKQETRMRIAAEAARIMSEEGLPNFGNAKRKAALRLGVHSQREWPSNSEVETELRQYQRLFGGSAHADNLRRLRREALQGMDLFACFDPRLVGAVLNGTAERSSAVSLHLFADTPEDVRLFMAERSIPHDEDTRRIRLDADRYAERPRMRFNAGDTPMDLTVFERKEIRQPPLSEVDGKPMRRANARQVRELIDNQGDPADDLVIPPPRTRG